VERLPCNLSSRRDGLLDVIEEGFDGVGFPPDPVLTLFELIVPPSI
jgi:hypothetical protein